MSRPFPLWSLALAGALPVAAAIVSPCPALADDAEDAYWEIEGAFRDVAPLLEPGHFELERAQMLADKADAGIAKLEKAKPDHPKLAEFKQRAKALRESMEGALVGASKKRIDGNYRESIDRDIKDAEASELVVSTTVMRLRGNLDKMREVLAEEKAKLASPAAQAYFAECEKWAKDATARIGALGLVSEAQAIIHDERIDWALEKMPELLDTNERDQAIKLWADARKAVKGLRVAKFKDVKVAQETLAKFDALEARFVKEMKVAASKDGGGAASDVPAFELDYANADPKVIETLGNINETFKSYQAGYDESQKLVAERLDLKTGNQQGDIVHDVKSSVGSMLRSLDRALELAKDLAKLDPKHAAPPVVEKEVPRLRRKAAQWQELVGRKCDYAGAIYRAAQQVEMAAGPRERAATDSPHDAAARWAEVIKRMRDAEAALAPAYELFPTEHAEADDWKKKILEERAEGTGALERICLEEGKRSAAENNRGYAEFYAEKLKEALPDSPVNAELERAQNGAASGRTEAQGEARGRGETIAKRAAAAADALRSSYEQWKAAQKCEPLTSSQVLGDLAAMKGKKTSAHYGRLASSYGDEFYTINGEVWFVAYDKEMRGRAEGGMKKLDDLYKGVLAMLAKKYGIDNVPPARSFYVEEVDFVVEVVGQVMYTPKRVMRDGQGAITGTVDGDPYPVPSAVMRALSSPLYVVVPGAGASVEKADFAGVLEPGAKPDASSAATPPTKAAAGFAVGESVAAKWKSDWFLGAVTEASGGACTIKWQDGTTSTGVASGDIKRFSPAADLAKGARVLAVWTDGKLYPGALGDKTATGFMVIWDDGAPLDVAVGRILKQ